MVKSMRLSNKACSQSTFYKVLAFCFTVCVLLCLFPCFNVCAEDQDISETLKSLQERAYQEWLQDQSEESEIKSSEVEKESNKEIDVILEIIGILVAVVLVVFVFRILTALSSFKPEKQKMNITAHTRTPTIQQTTPNKTMTISVDDMNGYQFERWCADLLRYNGFSNIQLTPSTGDQGVDIIAWKDGFKYAIQCKRYGKNLGNTPIQEVNTGRAIYDCNIAAVMTNQYFTSGAEDAARAVGVQLWDRRVLIQMVENKNAVLSQQRAEQEQQ